MRSAILALLICSFTLGIGLARPAPAAEAPFYEGKTIRFLIGSGPGGGTDTAGRLVARHLSKYLPGNPKIAIQNMGGGGGTIANNYFASEVKPDGLTIMQDSSSSVASPAAVLP
jgi:tripartite-type tricarboxylate transporter receptor subunit TctC